MASEPRGSFTIAARQRSFFERKTSSRSAIVPLPRSGPPSRTSRVGSPPVCESRIAIRRVPDLPKEVERLGGFEDRQGRPRLERLLDQRDDLSSLLADQRQARRANGLGANTDDALDELDVLHELPRDIEMQER